MSDVPGLPAAALEAAVEVPAVWREAAEEIRAHLCMLRGGAPFLSPADTWQLVRWLDCGVSVADVLQALERAAAARRAKRGKTPLSLVAANRHLGKPSAGGWFPGAMARDPHEPPLAPLVRLLEKRGLQLIAREADNFILPAYPGLILKDSYWRWPERNLAGNAIDFHVQVLGLSFHDAMRQITGV